MAEEEEKLTSESFHLVENFELDSKTLYNGLEVSQVHLHEVIK